MHPISQKVKFPCSYFNQLFCLQTWRYTTITVFFLIFNDFLSLQAQAKTRHKVMGVLDIYGFEIFEVRQMVNPKQALLA